MHQAVRDYLQSIKRKYPDYFKNKRVLELGSLNINGTPRDYFENCEYIGVDWMDGKDVDKVCLAHKYNDDPFDVIITTEMLEHDKYASQSIGNAINLLKPGGVLIGTCANIGREPHYEHVGVDSHYQNISKEMVESWAGELKHEITEDTNKYDIQFLIWK